MSRPTKFLVRYDHVEQILTVDLPSGPLIDSDSMVAARLQRQADTYIFLTYRSERGDLLAGQFILKENFFESEEPATLRKDLKFLATEGGARRLRTYDLWWLVNVVSFIVSKTEPPASEESPDVD